MLIKAKKIIGLPIYTKKRGARLENSIKDVVYDPQMNRVEALLLDEGGWFSEAKIILIGDIDSFGEDAVIIENEEKIKTASEVKQKVASIAKGENYLTNDKVITENGKELGRVSDIYFNPNTGSVEEFEVSQGAFSDVGSGRKTFRTRDIITVGEDAMIVSKYTDVKFEKQAKQQGIAGTYNQAKQQAPSVLDSIQQQTQDVVQKTKDKFEEIKEHPKTQETIQAAKDQTVRAKESSQQKAEDDKRRMEEDRKQNAVGKYLTVNILSRKDKILASRGDMITHHILDQAEENGVLEQVVQNTSNTAVEQQSTQGYQTTPTGRPDKSEPDDVIIGVVEEEFDIGDLSNQRNDQMYGTLGGKTKPRKESSKKSTKKTKQKKVRC